MRSGFGKALWMFQYLAANPIMSIILDSEEDNKVIDLDIEIVTEATKLANPSNR